MKRLPEKEEIAIDPIAIRIWEDVIYSMDQYTHDSPYSKFFLPEALIAHCRPIAAAFAQMHYAPIPSQKEVMRSRLYALFFLSMICGIQIYIKERSLQTDYAPYALRQDTKAVKDIRNSILKELAEGVKIYTPLDQIMELFLAQLLTMKQKVKRNYKDRAFDEDKFDKFLPVTMLFGYLFAKEMIVEI